METKMEYGSQLDIGIVDIDGVNEEKTFTCENVMQFLHPVL